MTAKNIAEQKVPKILPLPPFSDVPPRITVAITLSSNPVPIVGEAEESWAVNRNDVTPTVKPRTTKVAILRRSTDRPDAEAAFLLVPDALTIRP